MSGRDAIGAESVQRILEERARALACPIEAELPQETVDLVVLVLGHERYGIDVGCVLDVHRLTRLTALPGVPPVWRGLLNVRGTLRPVLDLRRYLGLPAGEPESESHVAIVFAAGLTVALPADAVSELRSVPLDEIGPPIGDAGRDAVRGVTRDLVAVLDLERLLGDQSLVVSQPN